MKFFEQVSSIDIQNKLSAFVQPIVNARTHTVVGLEVLLRYRVTNTNGSTSYISPDYILNQIESIAEYNLISVRLFQIVSDYLHRVGSKEIDQFKSLSFISFNIVAHQLLSVNFVSEVLKFRENISSCTDLVLELVEGHGAELNDGVIESIENLSNHGVKFGIDDFGHDSLSLKYIESLQCSILKMDKELSVIYNGGLMYEKTIKSLVFLASILNVKLIAEGVETKEQLKLLQQCGVNDVQGFYYARPCPLTNYAL